MNNIDEDEFGEELWRENLYYEYKEESEELKKILEKIKKIVDNEKITGIEAKLMIKDILEGIE